MHNFSTVHAIPWPLAKDKTDAYNQWETTANTTMDSALGRYGTLGTFGARQHPLSWFQEQVQGSHTWTLRLLVVSRCLSLSLVVSLSLSLSLSLFIALTCALLATCTARLVSGCPSTLCLLLAGDERLLERVVSPPNALAPQLQRQSGSNSASSAAVPSRHTMHCTVLPICIEA